MSKQSQQPDNPAAQTLADRIAREIEKLMAAAHEEDTENQTANWLGMISEKLSISRRHCTRVFQQSYGMSPREYLAIIRQQEAMHMLVGGSAPLEKISQRIGFLNVQSFIRQFTKWTGQTPGSFRKKHSNTLSYLTPLELEQP